MLWMMMRPIHNPCLYQSQTAPLSAQSSYLPRLLRGALQPDTLAMSTKHPLGPTLALSLGSVQGTGSIRRIMDHQRLRGWDCGLRNPSPKNAMLGQLARKYSTKRRGSYRVARTIINSSALIDSLV